MKQLTCSDFLVLQLRTMLLFCIIIFSGYSTFAQKIHFEPVRDAGRQAGVYSQYFTKYAMGSIDRAQVASLLQSNQRFDTLVIEADGQQYAFSLEAKDVRSDNYLLRVETPGEIVTMPRSPNKTYSGMTTKDYRPVCITADESFFTAMIGTQDGAIFIESAKWFDPDAGDNEFVIFNERNSIHHAENSLCGVKQAASHQEEIKKDSTTNRSVVACKTIEIALADNQNMLARYGTAVNCELHNLAVINMINTDYDDSFTDEYWHKVVEIYVGSPWYNGPDPNLMLNSFTAWAPTGFVNPHDEASLWTAGGFPGGIVGLAWVDRICTDSACNILVDLLYDFPNNRVLQSHELGHNYGYQHDGASGYIMSPSVSNTTIWSAASIGVITNKLAANGSCFSTCPTATIGAVGIGTTTPNNTSILDISSSSKGVLLPHLTPVQRNAIKTPADGLVVYDTHTKSFWFYNNTQWVEMIDGGSLQQSGDNMIMPANLGFGVTPPLNKIDIALAPRGNQSLHGSDLGVYVTGDSQGTKGIEVRNANADIGVGISGKGISAVSYLANADLTLFGKGTFGALSFNTNSLERMRITGAGNIGIGTSFPNAPLQFSNSTVNRKIVLYEAGNDDHQFFGFGVNIDGSLRYQVPVSVNDHVFYTGSGGSSSIELLRIKGSGNIGINNANASNKLDVVSGTARTGSHATGRPFYFTGDQTNAANGPEIRSFDGTQGIGFGKNTVYATGSNVDQDLGLAARGSAGALILTTNSTERIRISGAGNVGIGNTTPNAPLQFANNTANRKIVLWEQANNDDQYFGFGVNPALLRYQVPDPIYSHAFFAGVSNGVSTELMRIQGNGNVGINNTNPQNKLDVVSGSARTGTHATGRPFYFTGDQTNAANGPEIRSFDGTQGIGFGKNTMYATGSNTDQDLGLAARGSAGALILTTNGTERIRITGAGNMGIGTSTPNAPLQFSNALTNRKIVLYDGNNNDHQFNGIGINAGILRYQVDNTSVSHVFYAGTTSTTSAELFRIQGAGNVGINNSNPQNKLDVISGTARSGSHASGRPFYFTGDQTNAANGPEIRSFDGTQGIGFGKNTLYATGSNADQDLGMASRGTAGNLIFSTNNVERARFSGTGALGVGTSSPDASALVDINSTSKGVLIPRMSTAQRTAIASPQVGLLVFDNTTNSFWYRGSSAWIELTDNLDQEVFRNGTDRIYMGVTDSVGIGTNLPNNKLDIRHGPARTGSHGSNLPLYITAGLGDASNGPEVRDFDGTQGIGIGRNTLYAVGSWSDQNIGLQAKGSGNVLLFTGGAERFRFSPTGQLGIGVINIHATLHLANSLANRRMILWETANNDHQFYGFGINGSILRYQVDATASDHVFYAGTSTTTSNELFRIKGNGNVGIGTATPHAPLQLATSVANRKLVLYEVADNDHQYHGFGINGDGSLRYQTANTLNDHVFYAATSATTSNELARIKGNGNLAIAGAVEVENFITPTLLNNFTQYGNGFANAGYYKDKMGRVCLRGLVNNVNNPTGLVIFTLPAGYRPSTTGRVIYSVINNAGTGRVDILTNGDVVVNAAAAGWVSLDGITFKAD